MSIANRSAHTPRESEIIQVYKQGLFNGIQVYVVEFIFFDILDSICFQSNNQCAFLAVAIVHGNRTVMLSLLSFPIKIHGRTEQITMALEDAYVCSAIVNI